MNEVNAQSKPHILYVESNDILRDIVEEIFRDNGFDCTSCANAAEANAVLDSRTGFDVILISLSGRFANDIKYAQWDGVQLLRTMLDRPELDTTSLIVVSNHVTRADEALRHLAETANVSKFRNFPVTGNDGRSIMTAITGVLASGARRPGYEQPERSPAAGHRLTPNLITGEARAARPQ